MAFFRQSKTECLIINVYLVGGGDVCSEGLLAAGVSVV